MKKISHTRQELLDNTISRFNSNNRAKRPITGGCFYQTTIDGEKRNCAIGIEVRNPLELDRIGEEKDETSVISIFDYLPKRLQKMGDDFLEEIQMLHDTDFYWNEQGLSERGKWCVERIKQRYNLK